MDNGRYISVMLVGLSNAANRGLLSPTEDKKLADNVMDNKQADILIAQACESMWDGMDMLDGVNYYGN